MKRLHLSSALLLVALHTVVAQASPLPIVVDPTGVVSVPAPPSSTALPSEALADRDLFADDLSSSSLEGSSTAWEDDEGEWEDDEEADDDDDEAKDDGEDEEAAWTPYEEGDDPAEEVATVTIPARATSKDYIWDR